MWCSSRAELEEMTSSGLEKSPESFNANWALRCDSLDFEQLRAYGASS